MSDEQPTVSRERLPAPDLAQCAAALGISREAMALWSRSDTIDLHLDTFIWQRLFGYDLAARHGEGPFNARLFGQADVPRCLEAGLSGAYWIITTQPFRSARARRAALLGNLSRLQASLARPDVAVVHTLAGYRAARSANKHAAFIGLQGGNALELSLDDFDRAELTPVSMITLLHFTRSRIGAPALPKALRRGDPHLTRFGADYVQKLNARRILVDLAHISHEGFWDVLEVHDRRLPLVVSHAACAGVYPHFRNLDDAQLRALASFGGVLGVVLHVDFLGPSRRAVTVERVVDHIAHAIATVGDDHVALGSDFDGFILPPRDLKSVSELPRLVDALLRRGFSERSVQKLLGENFLRVLGTLRP